MNEPAANSTQSSSAQSIRGYIVFAFAFAFAIYVVWLLRSVLVASVSNATRARLHERIVDTLEDCGDNGPETLDFLAYHSTRAHTVPGMATRAVQHALAQWPQVEPVWLPTYAPWLNPIEKLWRWLKRDVLKMHRLAEDWRAVRDRVQQFLDQFAHGSQRLLEYVGLLGNGRLARMIHGP